MSDPIIHKSLPKGDWNALWGILTYAEGKAAKEGYSVFQDDIEKLRKELAKQSAESSPIQRLCPSQVRWVQACLDDYRDIDSDRAVEVSNLFWEADAVYIRRKG